MDVDLFFLTDVLAEASKETANHPGCWLLAVSVEFWLLWILGH